MHAIGPAAAVLSAHVARAREAPLRAAQRSTSAPRGTDARLMHGASPRGAILSRCALSTHASQQRTRRRVVCSTSARRDS
jgi:hypothetical protein